MRFATSASQTFKFNKMKTLSRNEMKKIMGGNAPEVGCKTACYKYGYDSGTCTAGTVTIGNTTAATCDCSITGATSCY